MQCESSEAEQKQASLRAETKRRSKRLLIGATERLAFVQMATRGAQKAPCSGLAAEMEF